MVAAAAAGIPLRILLPADATESMAAPPGTVILAEAGLQEAATLLSNWGGLSRDGQ
jgi:hypothetical protein